MIRGTFLQAGMAQSWDTAQWSREFSYLQEAGMCYLVLTGLAATSGKTTYTLYPTRLPGFQWVNPGVDVVDRCLQCAHKAGFKVFLGLQFNKDWWKQGAKDPEWLYEQMGIGNVLGDELHRTYFAKYPAALHGWYWEYEIDNRRFCTKRRLDVLARALNISLFYLKKKRTPLPMLLSPFMNKKCSTPETYAAVWRYLLANTELGAGDIFCPQDCVGAGGLALADLPAWFSALGKAVSTKPGMLYWANIENFVHKDWSSATLQRFIAQMEQVRPYVENIITFSYSHYYSPNNIAGGFHETYLNYLKTGLLECEKPTPPREVRIRKLGGNEYKISWSPGTDNIGIYGYQVYRNGMIIFTTAQQRKYGGNPGGLLLEYIDRPSMFRSKGISYSVSALDFAGNLSRPAIGALQC